MISPMVSSQLAEMVATWRDLFLVLDLLGDLGELFDGGLDGLVDAALEAIGFAPAVTLLQAFAVDGLGQHGGGGGAVAGASLVLLATSFTIWAPMFS
jgi:hypothetical protein